MRLYDKRNDIFDIAKVPKVLWVYRGDTHEVMLQLKVDALNVVFDVDELPASIFFEEIAPRQWRLTLSEAETMMLTPKQRTFTVSIIDEQHKVTTLYQGIMNVNNRQYSNGSSQYYMQPVIAYKAPTHVDREYLIGTMWIDTLLSKVYVMTYKDENIVVWQEITGSTILPWLVAAMCWTDNCQFTTIEEVLNALCWSNTCDVVTEQIIYNALEWS